jgi:hypothetical protein
MVLLAAVPSILTVGLEEPVHAQQGAAQQPAAGDSTQQAQQHFEKGSGFFEGKKFALALEEFKASYAAVPSPNSHLFIARCLLELGEPKDAYLEYDKVIAEVQARGDAKYADAAQAARTERDEIAKKLAFVVLNVSTDDAAATVTIGGKPIGREQWGKPVLVDPGTAEVVLSAPSKPPVTQSIQVAAGEKRDVSLAFAASSSGTPATTSTPPSGATPSAPFPTASLRPYAYVAGGVGAAGLIMFAVAGGISKSTYSDLEETCKGPCPQNRADDVKAGKTQQAVANTGLVIGLVGVAAGTTLFVLSLRKPKQPETTSVILGPGYMGLQGRF